MMKITDRAAEKINESLGADEAAGEGLRIKVIGGGCSGLQYKLDLDAQKKGDKVIEHNGAKLFVDRKSYLYINGTSIDYKDGLTDVGFDLDNPNVKRTCGCGESFVV
jgi:iron-sulfur cluster assembly accessory protein